jgi:hypothetical protein
MVAQVGYSVARRSRGRVAPCAVCTVHVETRSTGFLVEPQNQGWQFVSGLASKPFRRFSPGWPQNRWRQFLAIWPQNLLRRFFFSLATKLVMTVSPGLASKPVVGFLVEPQNQGGVAFPSLGLKNGSSGWVIWASKSLRQFLDLGLKTKQASVCRLHHKTDRGRSERDTHRDLAACFTWTQV